MSMTTRNNPSEKKLLTLKERLVLPISAKNLIIYQIELVSQHYNQVILYRLSDVKKNCIYLVVAK